MKMLVACEYSGIIRSAFATKGWDAWSCDILPTEIPGNHYEGNVLDILVPHRHFLLEYCEKPWDLIIAHPPCTYLSYAGMRNWYDEGRAVKRLKAASFFMKLYDAPANHICVENPRGIMGKIFRNPDQEVHPYYFGDNDLKRTGLWLKNLPRLKFVLNDDLFESQTASDKPKPYITTIRKSTGKRKNLYFTDSWSEKGEGIKKTAKEKSKSFPSIARAMAEQWTEYILSRV